MGDGVPQGVEYRPPVGACSDAGPASYEGGVTDEDRIHPQDFFDLVEGDRELMLKHNRSCIVVVRLRFRGKRRDFAVPLRSNIAPNVPKDQYFALPPRPMTPPGCRHGIHYIKMFRAPSRSLFDAVRYIPHWCRQIKGGPAATAAELQRFHDTLFAAYADEIGGNAVFRMKEWWFYAKCAFADPATVHKLVRKTKKVD